MIRLLIDKARLVSVSTLYRNASNLLRPLKEPKIKYSTQSAIKVSPGDNLAKDLIVYKFENPRFFHLMNIFAISQFLFWGEFSLMKTKLFFLKKLS